MIQEEGQASLRTLAEFCETHLREVVNGVHLLPHFLRRRTTDSRSRDYSTVIPVLGTWDEVTRPGRSYELMCDAGSTTWTRWLRR